MFAWYALQKRTPLACFKLSFSKESRLVSSFAAFLMHPAEAVAIFIAGEASIVREALHRNSTQIRLSTLSVEEINVDF